MAVFILFSFYKFYKYIKEKRTRNSGRLALGGNRLRPEVALGSSINDAPNHSQNATNASSHSQNATNAPNHSQNATNASNHSQISANTPSHSQVSANPSNHSQNATNAPNHSQTYANAPNHSQNEEMPVYEEHISRAYNVPLAAAIGSKLKDDGQPADFDSHASQPLIIFDDEVDEFGRLKCPLCGHRYLKGGAMASHYKSCSKKNSS